ncbi:MAG: hypothetical protein IT376_01615 [Polyangiaceae bacterium]|nr:hypothetical protein [Polyangiaceae bacterium]
MALTALLAVLAAAVLTGRAVADGERHLRASDEAFHQGDVRAAVEHARRAAIAYAPGAPHVERAYARLYACARGAEASREPELARLAWSAVRSAALETRHVVVADEAALRLANESLARLAAAEADDPRAAAAAALAELERDDSPRPGWVVALGVGFLAALAGLAWVAVRGITPEGRFDWRRGRLGLALALLGAACWAVAVLRA